MKQGAAVDRIRAPRDLLIDRYYRGARVMIGATSFIVAEAAVAVLEAVKDVGAGYECRDDDERALVAVLLKRGLLVTEATPCT
jgi:hypothetical protein